jgi:hypothetical protein
MIVVVGGKERRKYDVEEDVGKGKEEEENDVWDVRMLVVGGDILTGGVLVPTSSSAAHKIQRMTRGDGMWWHHDINNNCSNLLFSPQNNKLRQ